MRQLRLYLHDNAVLRCRGRLESAPLDDQSKFPVLLPRNEHFTSLVALAAHVQVLHSGVGENSRNSERSTGYLVDVSSLEASYANV